MTKSLYEKLKHELEHPPFNSWLRLEPVSVDEDKREVRVSMPYRPEFSMHPTEPILHGGVLATLIDVTGHASVAVWHGAVAPTINLNIEYLAPAIGQVIEARGILRRLGRTIARSDIEVTVNGKLVALGRGSFNIRTTEGGKA